MKAKAVSIWGAVFILACSVGVAAAVYSDREEKKVRKELAAGAFEYGEWIGTVIGRCEALQSVSDQNPDSIWANKPSTKDALASCDAAIRQHAAAKAKMRQGTT